MARIFKILTVSFLVLAIHSCDKADHKIFTTDFKETIKEYGSKSDEGKKNNFYINVYKEDQLYKNQRVLRLQGYHPDINIPNDLANHFIIGGYNVLLNFDEFKNEIVRIDSITNEWQDLNGIVKTYHPIEWTVLMEESSYKVNRVLKNTGYMPIDSLKAMYDI